MARLVDFGKVGSSEMVKVVDDPFVVGLTRHYGLEKLTRVPARLSGFRLDGEAVYRVKGTAEPAYLLVDDLDAARTGGAIRRGRGLAREDVKRLARMA